jgi:molybdopterin synthase catalytic subunit/molybdopterin converting factor small subunit
LDTIEITVAYLGGSRDDAGCGQERLTLPQGSTVADAARLVAERHPRLAPRLGQVRWARNFELVALDEPLYGGDELGLLPPVCGGAPRALLTADPIDAAEVLAAVSSPEAGATVVFAGTVRRHSQGRQVKSINYEAYEPMASRQLECIAKEVLRASGALDLHIVHRHGTMAVGEVTVVIAAAAPHREQAFAACRAAIERIKTDVPIWKHELTAEGAFWEGWGGG